LARSTSTEVGSLPSISRSRVIALGAYPEEVPTLSSCPTRSEPDKSEPSNTRETPAVSSANVLGIAGNTADD
jgi:hypothetical protein